MAVQSVALTAKALEKAEQLLGAFRSLLGTSRAPMVARRACIRSPVGPRLM